MKNAYYITYDNELIKIIGGFAHCRNKMRNTTKETRVKVLGIFFAGLTRQQNMPGRWIIAVSCKADTDVASSRLHTHYGAVAFRFRTIFHVIRVVGSVTRQRPSPSSPRTLQRRHSRPPCAAASEAGMRCAHSSGPRF